MNLLLLGGTIFLGRAIAGEALRRGHSVTLFTRGKHNPELFPEAEKLHGDRRADCSALAGRSWDAAIDTCGYFPRDLRIVADVLRDAVEHYTFVSSISVYSHLAGETPDEQAPVGTVESEDSITEITGENYGPLKAACERTAAELYGERALSVRPGLIVGPHDPTDRFAYWPRRVAQGGEVLAPGDPEQPVQFIDVRDLAAWMVDMAERRERGVYNATGPATALSMREFLEECRSTLRPDATTTWVEESFLIERGVAPFSELPLWVPAEMAGLHSVNCSKAIAAGLAFRPVGETIRDTYAWEQENTGALLHASHTLTAERERELLAAWHER